MDKNRRPETRADICRARRQVAKLIVKSVWNPVPQFGVKTFNDAKGIGNVESGVEGLKPQMVLFVDHDANAARQIDGCSRSHRLLVEARQLLADQMPFVEQQPVLGRELVDPHQDPILDRPKAAERLSHLGKDSQPLAVARSRRECIALEIPGQTNSGRYNDIGVLARCIEPAGTAVRKQREIEHHSIPRNLSRMSAASSNCSASIALFRRSRSSVAVDTCGSSVGSGAT